VSNPRHGASAHCAHCPGSHTGELPCLASATTKARAWLLVEHPGPWAEDIEDTDLAPEVTAAIAEARRLGVRPQLIRSTGRRRAVPPMQVYVGWSGAGAPVWLEGRELADPAELADLDLAAVADGTAPEFGEPVTEPLMLVCAHGRHNACCARNGAPLARALRERFGPSVWETSHVGGDRFAANLVCLPHGIYYGDLGVDEAMNAVTAYHEGNVTLDHLRGRAGLPEPAQAAEHKLREHTGVLGVDAITVESVTGTDPAYDVVVATGDRRYRVAVRRSPVPGPCGPGCAENRHTYLCGPPALLNEAALV
jgi:Sucrase/ferredoxin-like